MAKRDRKWTKSDSRKWRKEKHGESESKKAASKAEHDARGDYQKSGEPFGKLDKR